MNEFWHNYIKIQNLVIFLIMLETDACLAELYISEIYIHNTINLYRPTQFDHYGLENLFAVKMQL